MGSYRPTAGLREIINEKKSAFLIAGILMVVFAGGYLFYTQRPQPRPKGDKAFYTVDDGQTWFIDSIYKTPPFEHDGKTAVRAMVYSFDSGRQQFCPLVEQYTPEMKKSLDDAIAEADRDGRPLSSISLFNSPETADGIEVKPSGPSHAWVRRSDLPEAANIFGSIKAPDGSAVDFVIP
ncbi:MAG TPA: hypothetical protein VHX86_09950 [Tepidisphaeraceae bacterium]|jgi:hypothetical protein|nr:hypothetical protein [Tepidisphaeraceae bacterium]